MNLLKSLHFPYKTSFWKNCNCISSKRFLVRFRSIWPNIFMPNTHYTENNYSLLAECSLYRIRYNEHRKWSLHRNFIPVMPNTHYAEKIEFRCNGIRRTGNPLIFFGIMGIRHNAYKQSWNKLRPRSNSVAKMLELLVRIMLKGKNSPLSHSYFPKPLPIFLKMQRLCTLIIFLIH